jgi:hypothetical protein
MTATALDFGTKYALGLGLRKFKRALADVVDAVGLQAAADRAGTQKAQLRQAVDGVESRYVAIDYVLDLLTMAPRQVMVDALNAWLAGVDLEVIPRRRRTVEQQLNDLRERVKDELGAAGARIVEDERNRP